MDKHLNVFHAYRHGGFDDAERESFLEDNVTRALIISLRSCGLLSQQLKIRPSREEELLRQVVRELTQV